MNLFVPHQNISSSHSNIKGGSNITPREQQVLHLIAYEYSTKQIASELYVSTETINSHRKNIMRKLDVKNTAGMVRVAFERQLLRVAMSVIVIMSYGVSIYAQTPHLDVEGDARIVGKVNIIAAVGDSSVFIGANAGMNDDGANQNTFVGVNSGKSNTEGGLNSFFGSFSGIKNTVGSNNSFFGSSSGYSNTDGGANSFFGASSGYSNSSGVNNSFFGSSSGHSNTTGGSNSFFGDSSGFSNTEGGLNSFFGTTSGSSNTTGTANSFFGNNSGLSNTTGSDNSFFGESAGISNTTGFLNSFFGTTSGLSNTTGSDNSFFGNSAGNSNTEGSSNSFFGLLAGSANTTGSSNSFFGTSAGSKYNNTKATMIGYDAETLDSLDRAIAIGHSAKVGCHNCAVIGGTGADAVKVGISTTTPQAKIHIEGGVDASFTAASGYLINGPTDGRNMVIDDNEILARNNGAPSDLFINAASGNVAIGLTVDPTEKLDVSGNVRIRNMPVGTGDIVRIDANGKLWRTSSGLSPINNSDEQFKKHQSETIDNKKLITKLMAENEDLKKRLARLEAIVLTSSN